MNSRTMISKVNHLNRIITQKWYVEVQIVVNQEFSFTSEALVDSGADLNCLAEGLVRIFC